MKRLLVACECSGIVRDAFAALGWDAWSCDLKPSENGGQHYQCDVRDVIAMDWDCMIAHPTCTYLSSSGLHWNGRIPGREALTEGALKLVVTLMAAPIAHIAIENPIGRISTAICKPTQIVQPYQFGDDASKATCLWLMGLPKLRSTQYVEPRIVVKDGKEYKRWANQTDSGQNRETPSEHRAADRSRTYAGIARAFADQWGHIE